MTRLDEQLAALTTMSSAQLRAGWLQLYKRPAPHMTMDLLRRACAYKLQEKVHGGLSAEIRREIIRLKLQYERTGQVMPSATPRIKVGTRLVRDWGGTSHHVIVLETGYLYRDQRYSSLTVIAETITGTRWSGPRFFGLRSRAGAKSRG